MQAIRYILVAMVLGALAFWGVYDGEDDTATIPDQPGAAIASIELPDTLSQQAQLGQAAFEAKCSVCHGENAAGQKGVAPPLVHVIYEPSHHADEAFQRAVALGVRQHHWPFGNMPPVEGLTRGDVKMIIAYVRELQRANGING